MSGDINSLGHQLNRFSERNRHFRDFTLYSLISTLKEVIACFPVYRTYVTADRAGQRARSAVHHAKRSGARKQRAPASRRVLFDFIERLLLKQTTRGGRRRSARRARGSSASSSRSRARWRPRGSRTRRSTSTTGCVSLNEVGGDPTRVRPGAGRGARVDGRAGSARGRARCRRPRRTTPSAAKTCARGSTCCRRFPARGRAAVTKWRAVNRRFKTDVGGRLAPGRERRVSALSDARRRVAVRSGRRGRRVRSRDRIVAYMTKALREAKVHTSWLSPDEAYEKAVARFVDAILDRRRPNPFLQAFLPFQARVAELGIYNSLAQLLHQDHRARRAGFLSGHRAVGSQPGRSRQPAAGGLRAERARQRWRLAAPIRCKRRRAARQRARRAHQACSRCRARWRRVRRRTRRCTRTASTCRSTTVGSRRECLFAFARRHSRATSRSPACRGCSRADAGRAAPPLGAGSGATRASTCRRPLLSDLTRRRSPARRRRPSDDDGAATLSAAAVFERFPSRCSSRRRAECST